MIVAATSGLLSDRQMQQFLVDGYLLVQADFSEPVHADICTKLDGVLEREGNPGNNVLPRVPEIARVFRHPAVRGALTSLLGAGYGMNPHRHVHLNPPGSRGQSWHKDCYVFDHNLRHPRYRWVLALYYPQDVTEDMGPTGVLPGWHPYQRVSDPDPARCQEEARSLCGPAGTVALVHFDAWHRATANTSQKKRYMAKFQFARMAEPREPSWDHRRGIWEAPVPENRRAMCWDTWDWLRGERTPASPPIRATEDLLLVALESEDETEQRRAAFELSGSGTRIVPAVLDALRRAARAAEPDIEAKTADNAHGTNPTALPPAQALVAEGPAILEAILPALEDEQWLVRAALADVLGNMGPAAAPAAEALAARTTDEHWWVRRNAIEALGRIGHAASSHVSCLAAGVTDTDRRVRRVSALALAQLGLPTTGVVHSLCGMLEDEDRYNRHYAALALSRLPGAEARDAFHEAMFTARWCPITTRENPY